MMPNKNLRGFMAWQGIPYPSFISNTIDAGLTVTKIPEIIVDTGIGWDTILGLYLPLLSVQPYQQLWHGTQLKE